MMSKCDMFSYENYNNLIEIYGRKIQVTLTEIWGEEKKTNFEWIITHLGAI
jgi:hypothetical protein